MMPSTVVQKSVPWAPGKRPTADTMISRPTSMKKTDRIRALRTPILSATPPKKSMERVMPAVRKLTIQSAWRSFIPTNRLQKRARSDSQPK